MERMPAGKVDTPEAEASAATVGAQPLNGSNKQEVTQEDVQVCHKVTGSQSSIDHDKSEVKRSAGHRSKSFLEEPTRSKAASFMPAKHGDSSNRSTHGSHGDGITTASNLISKGFSVNEVISRSGDQHKIFETEKQDIFQPTITGSAQKLFDSEVTFADLVRVYTTSATKTEANQFQVGNALLSSPHASTVVSNYLNSYRCYLAHLRNCGDFGATLRDPAAKAEATPLSNVPLVLPLSRMTPVFSDDSHNDPEFISLLKKTTTESIRSLWPCRNRTNIFVKGEYKSSLSSSSSTGETTGAEGVGDIDLGEGRNPIAALTNYEQVGCSPDEEIYDTSCSDKDPLQQHCLRDFCQLVDRDHVSSDTLSDATFHMNLAAESGDLVFHLHQETAQPFDKETSSSGEKTGDEMVKTVTDGVHTFSTSSAASQHQTNSTCWSDAALDSDNESKLSQSKASHLNKLLQLQQKLLHQQHLQRQFMQHQQRQQQQTQQHQQVQSDQQLFQHFQNKGASQEEEQLKQQQQLQDKQLQQQQQQKQQESQQQQHQQQLSQMPFEKKQFSTDAKSWYPMCTGARHNSEGSKACLSTSTQLTTTHAPKADFQTHLQASMSGFDQGNKMQPSSQRGYPTSATLTGLPQPGMAIACHQATDAPAAQLRTLKASYACLDPHQPNAVLSTDHLFGPLTDDCSVRLCKDLSGEQSFGVEPIGGGDISFTSEESSRSWPNLNTKAVSGFPAEGGSCKLGTAKENRWSNSVESSVQERLKRAYVRTVTGDFNQGGTWADFPTGTNQHVVSKTGNDTLYGSELTNHTMSFYDQNPFYDSLEHSLERQGAGQMGSSLSFAKGHSSWPQTVAASGPFKQYDYEGDTCQGQISETSHLQHLISMEPGSRLSRLYQWRTESDGLPGPGCDLIPSNSSDALLASAQSDRDFSWNASSVASALDQSEAFPSTNAMAPNNNLPCSTAAAKDAPGSMLVDRMASLTFERKQEAAPGAVCGGSGLEPFREPAVNLEQGASFLERTNPRQQNHTWSNNGIQSSLGNTRVPNAPSLGCGPLLTNSMQVLNNKILSAQNNSMKMDRSNGPNSSRESLSSEPNLSPKESAKAGLSSSLGGSGKLSNGGQTGPEGLSQQAIVQQQQQQLQQQQQKQLRKQQQQQQQQQIQMQQGNQGSMFSLSDELEKTYLNDGLPSKPWHELTSEEQSTNDFQLDSNASKQVTSQPYMPINPPFFAQPSQTKDRCAHNNTDGGISKDEDSQGRATGTHRPRLILGANSLLAQEQRDSSQFDNLEESNRRLREMLGLNTNSGHSGKPSSQSLHFQDTLTAQTQHSSGLVAASHGGLPGQIMTNNAMNNPGARVQLPTSNMQSSLGLNPQMYCVPNILMPPPQAQSTSTSRASNMVLGGVNSTAPFPGMIRLPYFDMSRVVYIQQMPVNVASSQPNNNNHNNSTSSNPHVNVSNIITINTDKDFSNGTQSDKSGRLVRQNISKNKTTFLKVRSGAEEYTVPILGMRPSLDDTGCTTRQIKRRTNPWDQDLDQDFNSSLLTKAKTVEQSAGLGAISSVGDCIGGGIGEQGKPCGLAAVLGGGAGAGSGAAPAGASAGNDTNLQMATFMQWPASADMHPEMLDMLPVRRAGPDDGGLGGRLCWPDMEFMLTSRDQLQNTRRSNKPMGSNKANLISIIPRGSAAESQGTSAPCGQKDLELC